MVKTALGPIPKESAEWLKEKLRLTSLRTKGTERDRKADNSLFVMNSCSSSSTSTCNSKTIIKVGKTGVPGVKPHKEQRVFSPFEIKMWDLKILLFLKLSAMGPFFGQKW